MYDNITVKVKMPESWPKDQEPVFQTKDLECLILDYEIREDNKLYVERVKYKQVSPPKGEGYDRFSILPCVERESSEWVLSPFTGYVVFYAEANGEWFEYRAHIVCGVLLSIVDVDCDEDETNTLSLEDDLNNTRRLIQSLKTVEDHYYKSFIERHNIDESIADRYIFDYCYNDFGDINLIKENIK